MMSRNPQNLLSEDQSIAEAAGDRRQFPALSVLDRPPGYTSNQDVLRDCLQRLGHVTAREASSRNSKDTDILEYISN